MFVDPSIRGEIEITLPDMDVRTIDIEPDDDMGFILILVREDETEVFTRASVVDMTHAMNHISGAMRDIMQDRCTLEDARLVYAHYLMMQMEIAREMHEFAKDALGITEMPDLGEEE